MLGNVQRIVKIYNLYKSNLDYKIKSSLKTFNQINNQAEENTTTHKASSQIYIPQYASTVIFIILVTMMFFIQFLPRKGLVNCLWLPGHLFPVV